ncbi:HNH endonuclease signature motif containing protein [Subtercola endophyticus]|uniref:HNH endonuclease signature motif containing protein n=1 Tax=Subtercola endophyticus TaxID=2895559 RepID=UPI0036F23CB6
MVEHSRGLALNQVEVDWRVTVNGTRTRPSHPPIDERVIARFSTKYRVDESGCWLWSAAIKENGYGTFGIGPAVASFQYYAHRVSYEINIGPIPDGLQIDHLCRVRSCVNPAHLEPVTNAENNQRRTALITHCPRGHEYTDANTYVWRGARFCRECSRLKEQRARDRVGHATLAGASV